MLKQTTKREPILAAMITTETKCRSKQPQRRNCMCVHRIIYNVQQNIKMFDINYLTDNRPGNLINTINSLKNTYKQQQQ